MSVANGQSVQSDIVDAVVATLGETAWRCRFDLFQLDELPADNVIPQQEDPEYQSTDGIERRFRFHIRHNVRAVGGADAVADQRYIRGAKLLLADPTLGGLTRRLREVGRKWEMEQAEVQIVSLVVTYEAEFSTANNDPSQPGF